MQFKRNRTFWGTLSFLFITKGALGGEPKTAFLEPLVIQAIGDIAFTPHVDEFLLPNGNDYPFIGLRTQLRSANFTIGNLEGPIAEGGIPYQGKQFVFRMRPSVAAILKHAGVELVSLGNNHTLDQGPSGLLETIQHLKAAGVDYAGAGENLDEARKPAILTRGGRTIGFLSYSLTYPEAFWATPSGPGTVFGHEHFVRDDVRQLAKKVDIVIVAFHWGSEKQVAAKPYQRSLARIAVSAGADLVIGHHPHVVQGIEVIDGVPVYYSLGNGLFGSYSNVARWGLIARVAFNQDRAISAEAIPINVFNAEVLFQPKLFAETDANSKLMELASHSKKLGTIVSVHKNGVGAVSLWTSDH